MKYFKIIIFNGVLLLLGFVFSGAAYGIGPYTDNGNGTVTDAGTGLDWQQTDDATLRNWQEALAYCEGLDTGGMEDWRLPNIRELISIVDDSRDNPAIDNIFSSPPPTPRPYWSSTTGANFPAGAWEVNFDVGISLLDNKTDERYVRCVRGGLFALSVSREGSGSGAVNFSSLTHPPDESDTPNCSRYYYNAEVTLTADPAVSSNFTGWSGEGCSGTGECTVTVDQERDVRANFALKTYTINTIYTNGGTVTPDDPTVEHGNNITLNINPAPDYHILNVDVDGEQQGSIDNYTFLGITEPHTISVSFALDSSNLAVITTGSGNGTVTSDLTGINCGQICSGVFGIGTTVTLSAVPVEGSTFDGWLGGTCSGTGSCRITLTQQSQTVTAVFSKEIKKDFPWPMFMPAIQHNSAIKDD